MPRYLILRQFEVEESQMPPIGRRSRELVEGDFPQITWEHSHVVVGDDGLVQTYCVYEAPNEEMVREHSTRLGQHKIALLEEIVGDVSPADFPPA
jgi:uncharacterized protein DUF4242